MALLTDGDRFDIWAEFMRDRSAAHDPFGALTKVDLRAAVNAIDQWVSDNAASFNTAIPQPARAQLTTSQKALLLRFVVAKRFDSGV